MPCESVAYRVSRWHTARSIVPVHTVDTRYEEAATPLQDPETEASLEGGNSNGCTESWTFVGNRSGR